MCYLQLAWPRGSPPTSSRIPFARAWPRRVPSCSWTSRQLRRKFQNGIFSATPPPPSPRPRLIERRSTRSRANDPPNKETKRRRLRRFPFDPLLSRDWIGSDRLWSHAQYALGLTQAGSIDQATRRRTHVLANHGRNLASSFAVVAETLLLGTNQRPRP